MEGTLILLAVLILLAGLAGVIAFFMCLAQGARIGQLQGRISHLEATVNRLTAMLEGSQPQTSATPPETLRDVEKKRDEAFAPWSESEPMSVPDTEPTNPIFPPLPETAFVPDAPGITHDEEKSVPLPAYAGAVAGGIPEAEPPPEAAAPAPPPARKTDWETRIGKRWLTWGGVLLLVAAAGFLVKYAYDMGWIGPWAQVGLGIAVGCVLCVVGDRQIRDTKSDMRPLGQGMLALGLTLVYLTAFGAFAYFVPGQVSQMTTLGLLAATAAAGVLLANRHDSMPICILAAIGGYLAPILVATGKIPPVNGLFTYTLLVNLGIIGVSVIRTWPAMPLLALAGTVAHFGGWYVKFYKPGQAETVAAWAAIFHFTFLILPALPLIRGARTTPWQWLLPPLNAVLGVWVIWRHLYSRSPLTLLLALLAIAAAHVAIGMWNRSAADTRVTRGTYLALGLAILTLSPLAYFGVQANLVCWLVLGLLLVELGCRLGFRVFTRFGFVNLVLSLFWCVGKLWTFTNYMTENFEFLLLGLARAPSKAFAVSRYGSMENYLGHLFSLDIFWTRLLCPLAFALCAWILARRRNGSEDRNASASLFFGVAAAFVGIVFLQLDINPWMYLTAAPEAETYSRAFVLVPLWSLGAAGVAVAGIVWKNRRLSWTAILFLLPALLLAAFDLLYNIGQPREGYFRNAGYFASIGFALACMLTAWALGGKLRLAWVGIAGYLLILAQHAEIWKCLGETDDAQGRFWRWALLWGAGALAYLVLGKLRKARDLLECCWTPWLLAAVFAFFAFETRLRVEPWPHPFANPPYVAGLAVALILLAIAWLRGGQRLWVAIIGGWLLLLVNHVEIDYWLGVWTRVGSPEAAYRLYWALALLWNAGALAYALLGLRLRVPALLIALSPPLFLALLQLLRMYEMRDLLAPLAPAFVNMFFLNGVLACLVLFLAAGNGGRLPSLIRTFVYALTAGFGLLLLSLECNYWSLAEYGGTEAGRRAAKMSVSIAWALYSILLLSIGFATRIRGWRLAGLALFGITCVKLVLFDLSHLDQLHRILSFMALGLLLMAASYLYHKLEKRLGEGTEMEG